MGLSTTVPIWHDGQVVGTMASMFFLYTEEFVDDIAQTYNATITVFGAPGGNTRVSTTLTQADGRRAIGTELEDEEVLEAVLERGVPHHAVVNLFGEPFYTYYFPLVGGAGIPIGMVSTAINAAGAYTATSQMQTVLIIVGLIGTIAAAGITILIVNKSLKPLDALANKIKNVSVGNLNVNIDHSKITSDEIGALTRDVYGLMDVIKSMTDDISVLFHQFAVVGDIEYRIDENKYQNSFKSMMADMNKIMDDLTENIEIMLEVLAKISSGDFDVQVSDMPGKRMVIPQTIRGVVASLNNLNNELDATIKSVVNGDLSNRIDLDRYTGEWRKIMGGLNDITEAVEKPLEIISQILEEMKQGHFDLHEVDETLIKRGLDVDVDHYGGVFKKIQVSINDTINEIHVYIDEITMDLAAIAKGDLTTEITHHFAGDFAPIKDSINDISLIFHKTVSEISTAADQLMQGAGLISASAADLSSGALEQANSVQELNATIDIISQQTVQNADNAMTANEISGKSTTNAQKGNEAMKHMVEAMTQIKDSSNDIAGIVKTIQDIAFQTNLLALNASVEAARAGEHGRGFAVVAEEVRNLAGRSQAAATETTDLIQGSISRVESGSSIANETAQSLDAIVASANEVLDIISKISASSKEQAEAIASVSDGLAEISRVTQSNSAVSEETAAASEELNSQAELLRELVRFFKLSQ